MNIVIIIPAYNESRSIGALIDALEKEFFVMPHHHFSILVIDGSSPDGTADVVRESQARYSNIYLIVETKKRGLGMAYLTGMKYAMENLGADAFIEFDADFQHRPEDVKRLVERFDHGYDYVIGSRYVPGGGIPHEWGWHRKLLSKWGGFFIRWLLGLPTHDNTSGFKLSRVKGFADRLPLDEKNLLSKHYAYKIQLLYEMMALGAKTAEVPIRFMPRNEGESKSTAKDILESLKVAVMLKSRRKRHTASKIMNPADDAAKITRDIKRGI